MLALLVKCALGALAVLLIALLAKSKSYYIAGLVPLFPTFALIAHVMIGTERGGTELRATALFGLWSLLPYALYLGVVYVLSVRLALTQTLVAATAAWIGAAAILVVAWSRWRPAGV